MKRDNRIGWWWPKIDSADTAMTVAKRGAGAALFSAVLTGLLSWGALYGIPTIIGMGITPWNFLDAGLLLVLAFFINRGSRVAALVAALEYIGGQAYSVFDGVRPGWLMLVFISLFFINAVRATFALHRLQKPEQILNRTYIV